MQQEQPQLEMVATEHNEPFSPSIMTLVQTYELGQPQQEYLASFPLDPHGRAINLTIAVWLCAFLLAFLPVRYPWIIIWIAAALLLTLLIWAIAFLLQYRCKKTHYQRVYVCTSGLLCQRLNTIETIYWHHIETLKYDAVGNCQVHCNSGAVFFFSAPLQQLGELSGHIEQAMIPHHLSRLLTSYHDGLPIVFGPLRLNQQGIGLTQKNVILFAWDKVQGIERRFDNLTLKLYNDRVLGLPLTVHEIPSINLAQALIRAVLEEYEQITQKLSDTGEAEVQKSQETRSGESPDPTSGETSRSGASPDPTPSGSPDPTSGGILTTIMGDPIGTATSDRLSVIVYERGFLYLNKVDQKLDIVRWDQISQVIRRSTRKKIGLVEYSIQVTCNDETFIFPHTQPPIAGIGLYVEQKAAEWALPALLKQYDASETTAFGKLTINQAGITYNKRTLPWSEIYQVRILQPNSTHISIKQRGYNQQWQFITINTIPDVYLLKLLVDYILSTHPAVQR
jgi:hypothetical protein